MHTGPLVILYGVLLIKAVALALHEVPEVNSTWKDERLSHSSEINVGLAISSRQGGLVAPALLRTDQQELDELMKNFRDLVKRARAGSLSSSELSEPTITITSLGERGAESVFGIIYPPQVAIVGFGRPIECPRTVEGQIVLRPAIKATLSGDHRSLCLNWPINLNPCGNGSQHPQRAYAKSRRVMFRHEVQDMDSQIWERSDGFPFFSVH